MDQVEDYIWDRLDETEYLQNVVTNESLNADQLLAKVEEIQRNLDVQLRKGVEENYPRLLEQVSAIETLNYMQAHFDDEMQLVSRHVEQLGKHFGDYYAQLSTDVTAIARLTKLNRLLVDGLRCDEIVHGWQNEKDMVRQAEMIYELHSLLKSNEKLKLVKWFNDNSLFKVTDLTVKTRATVIEQLKSALVSLNSPIVTACLTALNLLYHDKPKQAEKELMHIMDESIRDLNSLFIQLEAVGAKSSDSMTTALSSIGGGSTLSVAGGNDKVSKFLPLLGNKLHSYLEQYQLLGLENAQIFARNVGKIIVARVSANAPFALKLLQTIYKCLITHPDHVAKLIREALSSLKTSILSQSLSHLFTAVDDAFAEEEKHSLLIVEKLNAAMRSELQSVNWNAELVKEMEVNIGKTFRYISSKVEHQILINEETLQLSGRISRQQANNYQMLSVAYNFIKHWPYLAQSLEAIIQPNLETVLKKMKLTIALVLASMHDENMSVALASNASSSLYMKELCNHLKVFRAHVSQIEPLVSSVEVLPSFLNYVIEQYLLHISLIRPLLVVSAERFAKDLVYLCRNGLQQFNCKSAKMLNAFLNIAEFFQMAAAMSTASEDTDIEKTNELIKKFMSKESRIIPTWFIIHFLVNVSGPEIFLPHESANWSRDEYIKWFNEHSEIERFKFFRNMMVSYQQSVIARNATEYVKYYPLINEIIEKRLLTN